MMTKKIRSSKALISGKKEKNKVDSRKESTLFYALVFLGVAGKDKRIYRGRVAFGIKPEFLQQSDAALGFLLNGADHFPLRVSGWIVL